MPRILTVTADKERQGGPLIRALSELPASREAFLDASFEESEQFSPTESLARGAERRAQGEAVEAVPFGSEVEEGLANIVPEPRSAEVQTPLLTVEQANERGKQWGLTYSGDTPEGIVDWDIKNKRTEVERRAILERSRGTLTSALGIGAQFLAQAKDPINIASAFIPVVGQARFASMVAKMGPTRARALTGAAEGTVGAALVEPIVLAQARAEQADYDFADALLNVTFGTALGGGLHVGVGRVADTVNRIAGRPTLEARIAAMNIQDRELLGRTAVAQMAEGRLVDVEDVFRAIESRRRSELLSGTSIGRSDLPDFGVGLPEGLQRIEAEEAALLVPALNRQGNARVFTRRSQAERILREMDDSAARLQELEDGRVAIVRRSEGQIVREPTGAVRRFPNERQARRFIKQRQLEDANVVPIGKAGPQRRYGVVRGMTNRDVEQISKRPDLFRVDDIERPRDVGDVVAPRLDTAIRRILEQERTGTNRQTRDVQASTEAALTIQEKKSPTPVDPQEGVRLAEEELAEAQARADEAGQVIDAPQLEDLRAREIELSAEQYGLAARAAAVCQLRRAA